MHFTVGPSHMLFLYGVNHGEWFQVKADAEQNSDWFSECNAECE